MAEPLTSGRFVLIWAGFAVGKDGRDGAGKFGEPTRDERTLMLLLPVAFVGGAAKLALSSIGLPLPRSGLERILPTLECGGRRPPDVDCVRL